MTRRMCDLLGLLAVGLFSLGLVACGGDDGDRADEAPADDDTGGSESGESAGSGEPWTDEDLQRLIGTEIDGFTSDGGSVSDFGNASVLYTEADAEGPTELTASVTIAPCDPFICFDLTAEPGEQQLENIRSNLSAVHLENPDLVEEIGTTELAEGHEAFTLYFRSFVDDGSGASTTNSYTAIFHDETNSITIRVSPAAGFDGPESVDELEAEMDQAKGEEIASEVFAAFESEFAE